MIDISAKIAHFVCDLILPLVIGYFLQFQNKLNRSFFDRMIIINILIIYQVLSVFSFWSMHLDLELIWLPILGVVMSIILDLISFQWAKRKYTSPIDQGSYILCYFLAYNVGRAALLNSARP